jgi:hypothetical protein
MAALPPSNLYIDLENSIDTLAVIFSDQTLFNKPQGSEILKWHTNYVNTLFDKSHLSDTDRDRIKKTLREHTVVNLKGKDDLSHILAGERQILKIIKQSNEPFQAVQEQRVEEHKEPLPEHLQPAKQQLPGTEAQEKMVYDLAVQFKDLLESAIKTSDTKNKLELTQKIESILIKLHDNKIIKDNSPPQSKLEDVKQYYNYWLDGRWEDNYEDKKTLLQKCDQLIDELKPGHQEAHHEMDKLRENLRVLIKFYGDQGQGNQEQIKTAKQEIHNCYEKLIKNTYFSDKVKEYLTLQQIEYDRMLNRGEFSTDTLETLEDNTIQKFPDL